MTKETNAKSNFAERAVKLRKTVKARNPDFKRHESWRYKRLKEKWRKPRGLDNKMRLKFKGWPKTVNVGYGGPRKSKALHPSGYKEILVYTPEEVANIDPNTEAARIAHSVGIRKRIQITSIAREREVRILNPLVRRKVDEEKVQEEELVDETLAEPLEDEEKIDEKPRGRMQTESRKRPKRKSKRSRRGQKKEVKPIES